MKLVSIFAVFPAALCASVLTADAQANLFVDPSYEGTLTFDGAPFVGTWEGFAGSAAASSAFGTTTPRTGSQHLDLRIDNASNTFAGAFQDVAGLTPGEEYVYSGWNLLESGDNGGVEIRIEWRDSGSDTEIARTPNLVPTLTGSYASFSLTDVVPLGADSARVVYAIQSFGGALSQTVFVDDVSFALVPEPATLGLAAFAVTGLALRRRR